MKNKKSRILIALLLAVTLGCLALTAYVLHTENYAHKIKYRLGLTYEKDPSQDKFALLSWQESLESLNVKADVAFLGDSITRGNRWQEYFPEIKVCNLGYSGDNVHGLIRRADMVKAVSPDKIFIMIGVNNLGKPNFEKALDEGYRQLVARLRQDNPQARLYIISILPVGPDSGLDNKEVVKANQLIKGIADELDIPYIDAHSQFVNDQGAMTPEYTRDGTHLTDQGKDLLAGCLEKWVLD